MKLSDQTIRNAKGKNKPYKLFDGHGLYIIVSPAGSKLWRFKFSFAGKEKLITFGSYPTVGLKEAREKRELARKQLAEGKNPSEVRKKEKLLLHISTANTFELVAREWHEKQKAVWTPKHAEDVLRRLEADVFPKFGASPVAEIEPTEVLAMLVSIEKRGAIDIMHRAKQTSGQVFRYAIATGRAQRDPTADLRGALTPNRHKHRAYLKEGELSEYLTRLEAYDGEKVTYYALRLLLLTFLRSAELRGGRWEEINWRKQEWRIPAARMKMKDEHIVPLASQTISLLREIQKISGNREHIFPNSRTPNKMMSENTLLYALYRMGYHSRATAHGFRATASTILNERGYRSDVIEAQLAHTERNKVRAAYNHAKYLPERREMMQWWADYIDGIGAHVG